MEKTNDEILKETRRDYNKMQGGSLEHDDKYWRGVLWRKYLYIVLVITCAEIVILFFDEWAGVWFLPWPLYITRFLVVPATINFFSLFVTYRYIHSPKYSEEFKNSTICYLLSIIVGVAQMTHYVFGPILGAGSFAIILSCLIGSKKTTRSVFHLSYLYLAVSVIEGALELRAGDNQLYIDAIVAALLYLCAYILAGIIGRKTKDDAKIFQDSIRTQIYLMEKASRDPQTDLYNKAILSEDLDKALESEINPIFLAVFDLDDFKEINDTYGHITGDNVIASFASILQNTVTEGVRAYRFGGKEFILVFQERTIEEVDTILEGIRIVLKDTTFTKKDNIFHVTVSIGLKELNRKTMTKEDFIAEADAMLYESKKNGKNCITIG